MNYYQSRYVGGVVVTKIPDQFDELKKAKALKRAKEISSEKSDPFAHGWRPYYKNKRRTQTRRLL